MADGTTWGLEASFTGCESYVFVPDTLLVSQLEQTSLWEADLPALLKLSPKTAHYFFVSRRAAAAAAAATTAMQARIDEHLATLDEPTAAHWKQHLHVVATRAADIDGWVGDVLAGHGAGGFAIDRQQRVRGVGNLADVTRFSQALSDAMAWPWKGNLAYAAYEPLYFDAQDAQADALSAEEAAVVPVFEGETLEQFAEKDVELPPAEELAKYDTLLVEISQACPDPEKGEFGNCGAWDYIASLSVDDGAGAGAGAGKMIEVARFITSYHRETHWVVDASPMLALLRQGGTRKFRWDFAPEWNKQPTATRLSLRFSDRQKGATPTGATPLFSGGAFDMTYNDRPPVVVDIPATAKKVEVYVLVTGHGSDANQCSEFCAHKHEIKVNGKAYSKKFTEAGTQSGCISQVSNGMVPNQGGTWWFGRGGWCPGKQVDPWVIDVTADVTPGSPATVEYRGLFNNKTPTVTLGNISFSSYLVVSE
jgi:hypothetical protein